MVIYIIHKIHIQFKWHRDLFEHSVATVVIVVVVVVVVGTLGVHKIDIKNRKLDLKIKKKQQNKPEKGYCTILCNLS